MTMLYKVRDLREGCEGHEVALPFNAFEKSGKRIAGTKWNP